jgi:hypothetical protein
VPTVTPPRYTKQIMVLLEPEVSGEVYAWARAQGRSASAVCRELIAAGLTSKRRDWGRGGNVPDDQEIEALRAEHRRQGEAQTERRREDDAERRKPSTGTA